MTFFVPSFRISVLGEALLFCFFSDVRTRLLHLVSDLEKQSSDEAPSESPFSAWHFITWPVTLACAVLIQSLISQKLSLWTKWKHLFGINSFVFGFSSVYMWLPRHFKGIILWRHQEVWFDSGLTNWQVHFLHHCKAQGRLAPELGSHCYILSRSSRRTGKLRFMLTA